MRTFVFNNTVEPVADTPTVLLAGYVLAAVTVAVCGGLAVLVLVGKVGRRLGGSDH